MDGGFGHGQQHPYLQCLDRLSSFHEHMRRRHSKVAGVETCQPLPYAAFGGYRTDWVCLTADHIMAPGYKGRAEFMFFAEQCRVRRKNLADFERQLNPLIIGEGWYYGHSPQTVKTTAVLHLQTRSPPIGRCDQAKRSFLNLKIATDCLHATHLKFHPHCAV